MYQSCHPHTTSEIHNWHSISKTHGFVIPPISSSHLSPLFFPIVCFPLRIHLCNPRERDRERIPPESILQISNTTTLSLLYQGFTCIFPKSAAAPKSCPFLSPSAT